MWVSEFDNIVSKKDKVQELNINQLKLEVYDTYKKDEKLTKIFEAVNDEVVINKGFLDTNLSKLEGQISYIGKNYNEFKLHNKEDLLIERAAKTTIQILYDKGLFDNFDNADQVLRDYLLVEVNGRCRPGLEQSK